MSKSKFHTFGAALKSIKLNTVKTIKVAAAASKQAYVDTKAGYNSK